MHVPRICLVVFAMVVLSKNLGLTQDSPGKVPVADAIKSKEWAKLSTAYFDDALDFEVRLIAFEKVTKGDLYEAFRRGYKDEGDLWLLHLEIKNVMKKPATAWKVRSTVRLIDEGGSLFAPLESSELASDKESVLHRFSGWSDVHPLQPKVAARGAIGFLLPKEAAKYSLTVKKTGLDCP